MKWVSLAWCVPAAALLLAPVGIRVATWSYSRPKPVVASEAQAGKVLFNHEWTANDPLSPKGDGLGPVFNANSCVACHSQGGEGGSGGQNNNVTVFTVRASNVNGKPREGVVHARAVNVEPETLKHVDAMLPEISQPRVRQLAQFDRHCEPIPLPPAVHLSQRNTPALFGAKLIDDLPDRIIIAEERSQRLRWGLAPADGEQMPVGRALRLPNGKIGKFGWKAQTASLSDFVRAACANELGLGNPSQAQPRPLSMPSYQAPGLDLTNEQCNQLTSFCASLDRPVERLPSDRTASEQAKEGKKLFSSIGCADCHKPNLGSVEGIYSDLLLHRMGEVLVGGGSYNEPPPEIPDGSPGEGPAPGEWRTPPLWGVADSKPYLHDGRAETLEDAIKMHAGQAQRSASQFQNLSPSDQVKVVAFLKTLRAP